MTVHFFGWKLPICPKQDFFWKQYNSDVSLGPFLCYINLNMIFFLEKVTTYFNLTITLLHNFKYQDIKKKLSRNSVPILSFTNFFLMKKCLFHQRISRGVSIATKGIGSMTTVPWNQLPSREHLLTPGLKQRICYIIQYYSHYT